MNNRVSEIWDELANANIEGIIKKSFSSALPNCIYCIFSNPIGCKGIAISYNKYILLKLNQLERLKDIDIYITADSSISGNKMLVVMLTNKQYNDIFSILCEDLIMSAHKINEPKENMRIILNQLGKWDSLFNKIEQGGMQLQEQQGLYGELFFLRKLLNNYVNKTDVISIWIGPDKSLRDFQYKKCAIEVKTTSSNNHQRLYINNERQLDETHLDSLFLYHLSIEASNNSGETLNDIIEDISQKISDDIIASNMFYMKLMEVGYFQKDVSVYKCRGYKIRRESCYQVIDDFPRIKECEIRNGVGEIKYTIIVDMCMDYLISEFQIYKELELCKK